MDLRQKYGTDKRIEQEGVDVHLGGGAYITLARAGGSNARFEREMHRIMRPHMRAAQAGTLAEDEARGLLQQVYARTVVLGWRGIELDGAELAYTHANCLRLFSELPDVWQIVVDEASRMNNFRLEETDERGKDSGSTSFGPPSGEPTSNA